MQKYTKYLNQQNFFFHITCLWAFRDIQTVFLLFFEKNFASYFFFCNFVPTNNNASRHEQSSSRL